MVANIITPQVAQQSAGFVMSDLGMSYLGRERVDSVHVAPTTAAFEGTAVCVDRHINDVAVKGAFPGTSAWSPPV